MSFRRSKSIVRVSLAASLALHAGLFGAIAWWRANTPPTIAIGGSGAGSDESELPGDAGDPTPVSMAPEFAAPSLPDTTTVQVDDSIFSIGPNVDRAEVETAIADAWKTSTGFNGASEVFDNAVEGSFGRPSSDLPMPRLASPSSSSSSHGEGGAGGGTPSPFADNPPPVYPLEAKRNRWEGTVRLRLTIDARGEVSEAEIAESSGHDILDQSAVKGARRWRFHPATISGEAVTCQRIVPIVFVLRT